MKCNVRELAHLSDQPCVIEGRLNYKKVSNGGYRNQAVFKERWFRLVNNYLFYFKISEMGKFDTKNPAGVFVMENSSIQMEHGPNISFSFSISFIDEPEKRHVFAARAEDNVVHWVIKLRECSYEYLRERLHTLQSKIYSITGKDPLLLVPRNEGACLWAPAEPYSAAPACTLNAGSFSCHLHAAPFTLERSKSDANALRHLRAAHNATFYTDETVTRDEQKTDTAKIFSLERSRTSAMFKSHIESLEGSIFDNGRANGPGAPSPPARTKLSPAARRGPAPGGRLLGAGILDMPDPVTGSRLLGAGILDDPPGPVAGSRLLGAGILDDPPGPVAGSRLLGAGILDDPPGPVAGSRLLGAGILDDPPGPVAGNRLLGAGILDLPGPVAGSRLLGAGIFDEPPGPVAGGRLLGAGILAELPVPPRRKTSPRSAEHVNGDAASRVSQESEEDLIKF